MRKRNLLILIPIALVILNFVLKFLHIGTQSIAGDEPFSIFHAQLDISSIIEQLKNGNNPPLFEIILHYWIQLFGISSISVRFLSLIFSSINVYFIYLIGKSFFNQRIAIVASLLFTFSNYHLIFAHECRVYPLFALLTTISMYAFFKLYQDKKYLALLFISNVLLIYSHYFGFWVLFIQLFISLVFKSYRKNILKLYLIVLLPILVSYIPLWQTIIKQFILSTTDGTWLNAPKGFDSLYFMLWKFTNKPIVTIICIVIILASLIKLFIRKDYNKLNLYKTNILIWFLLPFLLMFFISFKVPMFLDRYLIYLSIALYLLIAICIDYLLPKVKYRYLLDTLVVILFIVTFNPNMDNQRHVKETVAKVKELQDDNTLIIICPYHFLPNFTYYYNIDYFKLVDNKNPYQKMNKKMISENIYSIDNISQIPGETLNEFNKIVYLDAAADFANPNNNIINKIGSDFIEIDKFHFYQIFNVYKFEKNNE